MPRVGAWTADLHLEPTAVVDGQVEVAITGGERLVGQVLSGDVAHGRLVTALIGGAGGLSADAIPRHYVGATVRTVLADLMRASGERLSPTITTGVLNQPLAAWTVLRMTVGEQLDQLVAFGLPTGIVWRILPDGTVWVGAETWSASKVKEWRELERRPRERRLELGLDAPALLPGTQLGDDQIDYVEHRIDAQGAHATVYLAGAANPLDALRSAQPRIDYSALYRCEVVAQSADRATVDLRPMDPRIPLLSHVPLRLGIPGATTKIAPGAQVVVGWDNANPQLPHACLFGKGADTIVISITADRIELGGEGLNAVKAGVLTGEALDPFTGMEHWMLGNASTVVGARK